MTIIEMGTQRVELVKRLSEAQYQVLVSNHVEMRAFTVEKIIAIINLVFHEMLGAGFVKRT